MILQVKLLEDRVTRGTLNHILQTTLSSPSPQLAASAQNLSRMVNAIAPTMMVQGQEASFDGAFPWPNPSIENENNIANLHDSNATSGSIASNNTIGGVSCVTGLWPWDYWFRVNRYVNQVLEGILCSRKAINLEGLNNLCRLVSYFK